MFAQPYHHYATLKSMTFDSIGYRGAIAHDNFLIKLYQLYYTAIFTDLTQLRPCVIKDHRYGANLRLLPHFTN